MLHTMNECWERDIITISDILQQITQLTLPISSYPAIQKMRDIAAVPIYILIMRNVAFKQVFNHNCINF